MSLSIVAGPRPVYWSATARTASSDTSNSSPKSPNARPSPIVRNSLPTGSRPTATVPVPAITAMPQDSEVPERSAMKASLTIRRSTPGVTGSTSAVSRGPSEGQSMPASPKALAASESADALASSSAAPTATAIAVSASSVPAISQFEAPASPAPRTAPSSSVTTA